METHLDKFKLLFRGEKQRPSPNWHNAHLFEEDFVKDVATNESAVQFRIQFSSGVFGEFEQKLAFDFGNDNVLVCSIFVSVVSKDISEEEPSSRTKTYCRVVKWSVDEMELVPCGELMGMDLDGLCERYGIPNVLPDPAGCSEFSHETYCNIWHKILFIEERHVRAEVGR